MKMKEGFILKEKTTFGNLTKKLEFAYAQATELIRPIVNSYVNQVMKKAQRDTLKLIKPTTPIVDNKELTKAIQKNTFQYITNFRTEQVERLRNLMLENIDQPFDVFVNKVQSAFNISYSRAKMIAHTEIIRTYNMAVQDVARQARIKNFIYRTSNIPFHVCKICQGLNNKNFAMKELVEGKNLPPIHPHCNCVLIPKN